MINILKRKEKATIIHCCTEKTASQWFKRLLTDKIILHESRLKPFYYADLFKSHIYNNKSEDEFYKFSKSLYYDNNSFGKKVKPGKVATAFYVSYETMKQLTQNLNNYKAFFVLRDPRDLMVSVYYSMKHSHALINNAAKSARTTLTELDKEKGMKFCIDTTVDKSKLFEGQRSWVKSDLDYDNERVFRYEKLVQDYEGFIMSLLDFLEFDPGNDLSAIIEKYRFENFSKGRKPGEEDKRSHYRKAGIDQWKEEFSPEITNYFKERTGSLVEDLGYKWD